MNRLLATLVVGSVMFALVGPALAGDADYDKLQRRYDRLKRRVDEMEMQRVTIRLTAAQKEEVIKLINELAADAGKHPGLPSWLKNFTLKGDLRLRYQGECFENNWHKSRNRERARLRIAIKKTWWDGQMEVGARFVSGADDDGTSTNQSLDNHFSEHSWGWDRAYAKFAPKVLKGLVIIGGKFANPLVHTDLVWDSDINPEGVWAQYKAEMLGAFQPFVNSGYFIVEEESSANDVILVAYQAGFEWKISKAVKWVSALTYYDYDHLEHNYYAANGNHEVGGVLAAQEFEMINLTNKVSWKVALGGMTLPMSAYFDWVYNCGDEDPAAMYDDKRDGYAVGIKIGTNKKRGDWSFSYKYAYIEPNCTPGQFNDSDFGFANRKGHVWGATYNLDKFLTLGCKLFYTEPVVGAHEGLYTVLVQVDMVWKF